MHSKAASPRDIVTVTWHRVSIGDGLLVCGFVGFLVSLFIGAWLLLVGTVAFSAVPCVGSCDWLQAKAIDRTIAIDQLKSQHA